MRPNWRVWSVLAVTVVAGFVMPSVASADHRDDDRDEPDITRSPWLRGTAQVGQRLDATGASWWPTWSVDVEWRWLRCTSTDIRTCRLVDGAESPSYTLTSADVGRRLIAVLIVSNRDGYDVEATGFSNVVTSAPPPPPAIPVPAPVVPAPVPIPEPVPVPAPVTAPQPTAPLRMMRPTPIVRVRGWLTPGGAVITRFSVRAPRGARITARCYGRGCPRKVVRRKARHRTTRLKRFEGRIRAGTRFVISVRKGRAIGKHTVIRLRSGKAPARRDRCLAPGSRKPIACPTG